MSGVEQRTFSLLDRTMDDRNSTLAVYILLYSLPCTATTIYYMPSAVRLSARFSLDSNGMIAKNCNDVLWGADVAAILL